MTLITKPTAVHRAHRYLDMLDNKINVEIRRRISHYLRDEAYLRYFGLRIDGQNRLTLLNAQEESSAHFAVRFRPNSAITLFSQGSSSKALFNFAPRELLSITQAKFLCKRLFRVLLKSFLNFHNLNL